MSRYPGSADHSIFFIGDTTMSNRKLSKLLLAGLLLGAGAAQAAGPTSVSEVPGAWYADRIVTSDTARGAAQPVFPISVSEYGPIGHDYVEPSRPRPSMAGRTLPFPASPNESGSHL
jgi:hypothetical protein